MLIKDELDWVAPQEIKHLHKQSDQFIVEEMPEGMSVEEVAVAGVDVVLDNTKRRSAPVRLAEKYVSLVSGGKKPWQAAKQIGTTLERIATNDDMRRAIKRLMDLGRVSGEVTRELLRAGNLKIYLDNIDENSDIALKAAKLIAQDPAVGLVNQTPLVEIDLGSLGDVFKSIDSKDVIKD